jgi:hypothetical protein
VSFYDYEHRKAKQGYGISRVKGIFITIKPGDK